jgi:UPF0716 family protein affecting phage T7 exclusion
VRKRFYIIGGIMKKDYEWIALRVITYIVEISFIIYCFVKFGFLNGLSLIFLYMLWGFVYIRLGTKLTKRRLIKAMEDGRIKIIETKEEL